MTKKTKTRRSFSEEFKTQIVQLYLNGKRKCDIIREYDLSPSVLNIWIKQFENTSSFKKEDNTDPLEKELHALRKRNKQLEMENDILKQAALILGQK
jgi:transposase